MRRIVLVLMILIGLAPAPVALAHASLISAQPEEGAVLDASPERLILIFNEPISPLRLQLIDPRGQATALTDVVQHDATIVATVPGVLQQGTHVLSWRVVSADGHPVGGTVVFSVGQADAVAPLVQTASDLSLRIAIWAARVVIFAALFFGVGGAFFAQWFASARLLPRNGKKFIVALLAGGFVAVPLSIGLHGVDALGAPLSAAADGATWRAALGTSYGTAALIMMLALGLALSAMAVREPGVAKLQSLAGLAATGLALAATGHAATASPELLTRPAVFMHVIAGAFWIGSLWPLAVALRAPDEQARAALSRFSRVIFWAVALLLVSGSVLAVVQVGRVEALWTTAYGWVLLAKLGALLPLFGLAAINRFWLTRRVQTGDAVANRNLRHSIAVEVAIAFVVLGIVALWRFTPPPRSLAAVETASEFIHFHGEKMMADVTLEPGRAGRSSGEIVLRGPNFELMTAKEVTVIFSLPAGGIESIERRAVKADQSTWKVENIVIPTPGRWHLRIEALIGDFDKLTLEDDILVRP